LKEVRIRTGDRDNLRWLGNETAGARDARLITGPIRATGKSGILCQSVANLRQFPSRYLGCPGAGSFKALSMPPDFVVWLIFPPSSS
jgi:hypothetical protein